MTQTIEVRRNEFSWWVYGGGSALLIAIYFAIPNGLAQSIFYDFIGLIATGAIVAGIRRHRPEHAAPWWMFAVGTFLAVAGDAIWTAHDAIIGGDPPFPWFADVVYLASYPFLAVGLLMLVRLRRPGGDREALLDALIISVSLGAASWVFLMEPHFRDDSLTLLGQLVALAYPAMDLVLLAVAIRFLATGGFRRPTLSILLGGIVVLVAVDVVYGWAVLAGTYHAGDPIDAGWLLSYLAFGAAALHPSMALASRPEPAVAASRLSYRRLVLLGSVALAGPAVLAIRQIEGARVEAPVLIAASAVLFILALLRVGGLAVQLNTALDERVRAEERVVSSEERFRGAFTHAPIGMALVDEDGRWRQVNRALCDMLGYREAELLSMNWRTVTHPEDVAEPELQLSLSASELSTHQLERRYLHKDGHVVWIVQAVSPAPKVAGQPTYDIWQLQDVTARKGLEGELRRLALLDPLTGLPNRALFADRLAQALNSRRRGEPVAVLFLDLDRFKVVNDSLGHAAGDRLLCAVADRLSTSLRAGDTVARFGGDEFVALLEGLREPQEATEVAQRLLTTVRASFLLDGQETTIGISIGIAVGWPGRSRGEDLMRHADMALYRAKEVGRATFAVFDPGMGDEAARRLALETDLRRALERDEMSVRYQPIVDLLDGRVVGAEALVRWEHPVRGLVSPGEFIDLAEETGLIVPLGANVLQEACRQAALWQPRTPGAPPFIMSVNLSARQVRNAGILSTVAAALASSGLPAAALQFELTERVLVEEGAATAATLLALKGMGVALAIDDFGTGYSSLSSLRHLPVDALKIDRSFVAGLDRDASVGAIVEAMVGLARALGLVVTAEGIETDDQLARVLAAGCTLGQGFLFGAPMEPQAFEKHLASEAANRGGSIDYPESSAA